MAVFKEGERLVVCLFPVRLSKATLGLDIISVVYTYWFK
jgi:hypothetical protein